MRLTACVLALTSLLLLTATASRAAAPVAALSVTDARVTPTKTYFGRDPVTVSFGFAGPAPLTLHVEVVSERTARIARRFVVPSAVPGEVQRVQWDGITGAGRAAADGRYRVRVVVPGSDARLRLGAFTLRGRMYPIRGPHADRGPAGQFGVGRNGGRTHEGYDVNAACGTRLVAARAGTVIRSRFDPKLYGHEVIIRGLLDGREYRYAHLRSTPEVRTGEKVRTGQQLGEIGDTGNARTVGCHLHFELRDNGRLVDPRPRLHEWDRFS